jgi:hypothetical protein
MATSKKQQAAPALSILLAEEVTACKKAGTRFQGLYRAMKEAEGAREIALNQLFVKMGFESFEAVKKLKPARLRAAIAKKLGKVFMFENKAAASFAVLKTWEGRSPKWREQLIARLGAEVAAEIESKIAMSYSYTVIDPPEEPGPSVITIPQPAVRRK